MPSRRRSDHDSVEDDRVALDVVARIERLIHPGDLKPGNVRTVDLCQRRISGAGVIAMRTMPGEEGFPLGKTIGRRQFLERGWRYHLVKRQSLACLGILH